MLTGGQVHDSQAFDELVEGLSFDMLLADTAYDSNKIVKALDDRGAEPVIPSNPCRKTKRPYDETTYWYRYLVERLFHELKRFRRVATRFEKRTHTYIGMISLAASFFATA